MIEIPIDHPLTSELERDVTFGGEQSTDSGGFSVIVNDQPIGLRLRDVLQKANVEIPSTLYERFDVWLIPHRLSVVRRSGLAEPTTIGIEVEYVHDGSTCSIVALVPSFAYVVHGEIGAGVSVRGNFMPTGEAASTGGELQTPTVLRWGGLDFAAAASGDLGFRFHATVATPKIAATGLGASRCEWRFDRDREPLFGRDIETYAAVVLNKRRRTLRYRVRFYVITRLFMFPSRRESVWSELNCELVS